MSCTPVRPVYPNPPFRGLAFFGSKSDGYEMELRWFQAFSPSNQYQIAYNIYYSTIREDVFTEGVKFVEIDGTVTSGSIFNLTPGDQYFAAVRALCYETSKNNLSQLPVDPNGFSIYSEGMLLNDIGPTDTLIPISDINTFPHFGIVQIGGELIQYSSVDLVSDELVVANGGRGFYGTNIRPHTISGFDGYEQRSPIVRYFAGFEEENISVIMEECKFSYPSFPYTLTDGYRERTEDLLTTDFSENDAATVGFPAYDFSGYHSTDPVDILAGNCLNTYIGGEQGCADGYLGVGMQVKGLSMNDSNTQRQEVLLSTDAEPCVLFRRMWTGKTCSCVDSSKESPEPRCPYCFPPGTLVKTEIGWRSIEKIKVGEKVLSSDGLYHGVTKIFENQYDGYLNSITPSISANPILSTPEHPYLVLRGEHHKNIGCGPKCDMFISHGDGTGKAYNPDIQQLKGGNWHARITTDGNRKALGSYKTKEEAVTAVENYRVANFSPKHTLEWDLAENIEHNDWLVAKWNNEVLDINEVEIPVKFRKNTKLGSQRNGPNKFVLDEEFLWIIGIYLAEGSHSKREINFALHRKEIEYQQRIVRFFKKYGYNTSVRNTAENGSVVAVNSTTLSNWFPAWLGTYCYNKKFPEELMRLPNNKSWALINGVYDGDGNKRAKEIGQTSEILALQLSELLHRVGEQPLIRRQQSDVLTPKGNKRRLCYIVSWAEDTFTHNNRKGRWVFGNEILTQVKNVDKTQYSGSVYNLEVEGNHTYVVQGVVVHNCFGTGFVSGYTQYFNPRRSDGRIMVRFDPSVEDLVPQDSGLESTFAPTSWTLTVPAIKDRDFLIRFNDDQITPEFRYEILNVTRNKMFLDQYGAQKMALVRIRKTDQIYQVRSFNNTATMPQTITTTIGMLDGPNHIGLPHLHNLVISETITSPSQINQETSVSLGHNHVIKNGVVLDALGHSHSIILP